MCMFAVSAGVGSACTVLIYQVDLGELDLFLCSWRPFTAGTKSSCLELNLQSLVSPRWPSDAAWLEVRAVVLSVPIWTEAESVACLTDKPPPSACCTYCSLAVRDPIRLMSACHPVHPAWWRPLVMAAGAKRDSDVCGIRNWPVCHRMKHDFHHHNLKNCH